MTASVDSCPNILYRYRSLEGNGMERLRHIISSNTMYFANPSDFNDPYDCRPAFSMDGSQREQTTYLEGVFSRRAPYMDRAARRAEVRRLLKSPTESPMRPEAMSKFASSYYEDISSRVGLLCLTESRDDILMWSHYAASHRGVCLGFNSQCPSFSNALRVRYEDNRPVVNPVKQSPDEMLEMALLTKARHWEYEREWRVIRYKGGAGTYQHSPEDLVEVILGSQVGEKEAEEVRRMVTSHPSSPRLLRAALRPDTFQLQMRPI